MKFFIKKLITLIITLLVISFLTFTAFSVIPGDAALSRLGKDATEEQLERARDEMGLNDPLLERYGRWVTNAMQGDFGESYRYEGTSVRSLLAQRLPVTVLLAVISLLIITVISVPLGILSARFAGKWVDTLTNCLTQILMAVPSFFLGMILTYVFGLILHMFQPGKFIEPSENFGKSAQYLLFPALAVALPKIAMVVKFLRSSILTEMNREYVRTAYSRGNTETAVLYGHVLKNAMIPVVTFFAMVIAEILAGSIVAGVVAVLYYKYLNLNGPVAVSAPIFQQFNPFYVVALTPVSIAIFSALARRGKEPSAPRKIAYGMLVASAGFAIMAVGSLGLLTPDAQEAAVEAGEQVPLVSSNWLISTYLVLTFAELLLSPMGISFVSKVAPPQYKGMMMGGWFGATAIGNLLVAVGGFLWGGIPLWAVWTVFIVLCLLSAVFMFSMMKKLESVTTDA
mgnify:CR=1 FL=1